MIDFSFYKGKKVLITGNTGFKGSWMTLLLKNFGAEVVGYSLKPNTSPALYEILQLDKDVKTYYEDIRNYEKLKECFSIEKPEIVFHLAAQPIVRESYENPLYTYECNVLGTANILECVRLSGSVKSFVNITTDKVYRNNEWEWGYRENDPLDGYDPYSNSKSCSELITASYKRSFEAEMAAAISTARAGNVIGGGDFARDRIVPDCFRHAQKQQDIVVRNPNSVRPYQHVLEPIVAYIMIAAEQYLNREFAGVYNVGPNETDCITTGRLADAFCRLWGENQSWNATQVDGPHEANFLKLDCSRLKRTFGWHTTWTVEEALKRTVDWYKAYLQGADMREITSEQIDAFISAF